MGCDEVIKQTRDDLLEEKAEERGTVWRYKKRPTNILLVKRWQSQKTIELALSIAGWMHEKYPSVTIWVESNVIGEFNASRLNLRCLDDNERPPWDIELVVAIGGDGTMLWVSHLYGDTPVPPVLGISAGTLGYLTLHETKSCQEHILNVMEGTFIKEPRSRLSVRIGDDEPFVALNECVVDRGPHPAPVLLELTLGDKFETMVSADGIIMATPTGSTAYNMSAGGPMVHSSVPCIVLAPICPLSLSLRNIILPEDVPISILNPSNSRGVPWVSIDGRRVREIPHQKKIDVKTSNCPYMLITHTYSPDASIEPGCELPHQGPDCWLTTLKTKLHWNRSVVALRSDKSASDDGND